MFEARVAQFYRARGYEVHENPKVRGSSENVYTVALVADGPLGALLISFGDAGGIDGAEIGRVRTMARDIGATPVLASLTLSPDLRRLAAQMGVVVVDDAMVTETGPMPRDLPALDTASDPLRRDMDAHPWPASGRAFSFAGPTQVAARDVDDLVSDLHRPAPAKAAPPPLIPHPATEGSQAGAQSGAQAALLVPPAATAPTVAQPSASATPPANGAKFAWLGNGQSLLQTQGKEPATTVDLSALLGAHAHPLASLRPAALEHESQLLVHPSAFQRAHLKAYTWWDSVRDWPWKTIIVATAGAGLMVLLIRWFA